MMLQVFAVFDKAVGAFLQPFYARSRGEAIRSFADACNQESHQFFKHSQDYSLMWLGEFDDANAVFSVADPVRIMSAFEAVEVFEARTRELEEAGKVRPHVVSG